MTIPVQTPTLPIGIIVHHESEHLPDWFIEYLQARRRALLQEIRQIEKTLVEAGELPPSVLAK
jgi:hypothetical protein